MSPDIDTIRQALRKSIYGSLHIAQRCVAASQHLEAVDERIGAIALASFGGLSGLITEAEATDWSGVVWREAPSPTWLPNTGWARRRRAMRAIEFLEILTNDAKAFHKDGVADIERNTHLHDCKQTPTLDQIDAVLTCFINTIGVRMCVDYALHARDLKDKEPARGAISERDLEAICDSLTSTAMRLDETAKSVPNDGPEILKAAAARRRKLADSLRLRDGVLVVEEQTTERTTDNEST